MKFTIASLVLLLCIAGRIHAQTTPYDSLTVDSLVGGFGVNTPSNIEGAPDRAEVTISGSEFMAVMFFAGSQAVTMEKGAPLHVFWIRLTQDSAAADIEFVKLNLENLALEREGPHIRVMESGPVGVMHETTIAVPDTGFNALQITTAADTGATICWVDAISLIQSGVAAVNQPLYAANAMQCYPNPVQHTSMANIELSAPVSGRAELIVSDVLGQEIERLPIGQLSVGATQEVKLSLKQPGVFFARLVIDGAAVGAPLKVVAE